MKDRRCDVEQACLDGLASWRNAGPVAIEDPIHPMIAGWSECRCDHPVGGEIVQSDRAIPPVREHDRQVRGQTGVRPVVELVALVNMLDERLAGFGMRNA